MDQFSSGIQQRLSAEKTLMLIKNPERRTSVRKRKTKSTTTSPPSSACFKQEDFSSSQFIDEAHNANVKTNMFTEKKNTDAQSRHKRRKVLSSIEQEQGRGATAPPPRDSSSFDHPTVIIAASTSIMSRSFCRRVTLEPSFSSSDEEESEEVQKLASCDTYPPLPSLSTTQTTQQSTKRLASSIEDVMSTGIRAVSGEKIGLQQPVSGPESLSTTSFGHEPTTTKRSCLGVWRMISLLLVLIMGSYFVLSNPTTIPVKPNSIYLPGAGFSGFWFTLGRLEAMMAAASNHHQHQQPNFYCFSAGCLAAVSFLSHHSTQDIYQAAVQIQQQWKTGNLHQHDVVEEFLEFLLFDNHGSWNNKGEQSTFIDHSNNTATITAPADQHKLQSLHDPNILSSLHIITTKKKTNGDFLGGFEMETRTPTSLAELKEMLRQTTWIPFATGSSLWHNDRMDGGVTYFSHPWCERSAALPLHKLDLLVNILNVNLGATDVQRLYESGISHGL
jgi:hypothetical protein